MATQHSMSSGTQASSGLTDVTRWRSRILYITASSPIPSKLGPARRNYHILDQLCRFYDVTHLSLGSRAEAEMFAHEFGDRVPDHTFVDPRNGRHRKAAQKIWRTITGRCDFAPVLESRLHEACAQLTATQSFDAIFLSIVLLQGLPLPKRTPVVGDTHNVEFDVLRQTAANAEGSARRLYSQVQWRSMRRAERRCAHAVDLLLATSERDRQVFEHELQLHDVGLVANGIDLREFAPRRCSSEPGVILFTGLMSYYPNQQAVRWFLDSIFPSIRKRYPAVKFVVGGAAPPAWLVARQNDFIEVTGGVPDMRPHLARASVFIAPLRIGGGTRVKILEAAAMNRVVVSTALGAQGLGLTHGKNVLIADDAESFADCVLRALEDPAAASRMAAASREHVKLHFDWERIGEGLARLLDDRLKLASREAPRGPLRERGRE